MKLKRIFEGIGYGYGYGYGCMESSKKLHVERMCVSTGGSILAWEVDDA